MSATQRVVHVAPVPELVTPPGCEIGYLSVDAAPSNEAWGTLSADEQQRALRYRTTHDQWAFVTTRYTLRCLIGDRLGIGAATVVFDTVGRAKPVLAEPQARTGLQFSVSHASGLAVIAVADQPIGVDIERVRPEVWDLESAALVLSPQELDWLQAQSDADTAFFECWTRKEAWVKMGDQGLIDELTRITLTPRHHDPHCQLSHASPWPGVIVACAITELRR